MNHQKKHHKQTHSLKDARGDALDIDIQTMLMSVLSVPGQYAFNMRISYSYYDQTNPINSSRRPSGRLNGGVWGAGRPLGE